MKILVTGGAGFIGQHLMHALGQARQDALIYDIVFGQDVRNRRQLETLFEMEHFDVVIHLAALAGVRRGELYPDDYLSTNVLGTKNVVDLCEKYNVRRLINFSSSSVYGDHANHGKKLEIWPTEPKSIYGMSKLMAELIVARSSIETFTVRPFTVYGPDGRKDQVMVRWIEMAKKGQIVPVYASRQKDADRVLRGYTHVDDLIAGVLAILSLPISDELRHEVINLGGDRSVSLLELVEIFGEAIKDFRFQYVGRQAGDVSISIADTTKALRLLNWQPKMDFAKEVKKLIKEGMRS